jgi:hypothetical protein
VLVVVCNLVNHNRWKEMASVCRVCLGDDDQRSMIWPCSCVEPVHRVCVEKWRAQGESQGASSVCFTCKTRYALIGGGVDWRAARRDTATRFVKLMCLVPFGTWILWSCFCGLLAPIYYLGAAIQRHWLMEEPDFDVDAMIHIMACVSLALAMGSVLTASFVLLTMQMAATMHGLKGLATLTDPINVVLAHFNRTAELRGFGFVLLILAFWSVVGVLAIYIALLLICFLEGKFMRWGAAFVVGATHVSFVEALWKSHRRATSVRDLGDPRLRSLI